MKRFWWLLVVLCVTAVIGGIVWADEDDDEVKVLNLPPDPHVVRCAVIGGMTMVGMWQGLTELFEAKYPYKVKVIVTGPRPPLDKAFREGKADLLTMHSGDVTTNLVADGYGTNMRPWTRNDLVLVGPADDPAHVAGLKDGAEALRRIAKTHSNFIDVEDAGAREMAHNLWTRSGIEKPRGKWIIQDASGDHLDILKFAKQKHAYIICGRMPILHGKLRNYGMKVLVDSDPTMRRPYIVMEANPEKVPGANTEGARALADFMLSEEGQSFLATYGNSKYTKRPGPPLFYPVQEVAR